MRPVSLGLWWAEHGSQELLHSGPRAIQLPQQGVLATFICANLQLEIFLLHVHTSNFIMDMVGEVLKHLTQNRQRMPRAGAVNA